MQVKYEIENVFPTFLSEQERKESICQKIVNLILREEKDPIEEVFDREVKKENE